MATLIIEDGVRDSGGLSFDLTEVLTALGDFALHARWRCRDLSYFTEHDQPVSELDRAETQDAYLSGPELLEASHQVEQVIDGEFVAVSAPNAPVWFVVRAVDSTWWEVESDDAAVLAAVREAFKDVRAVQAEPPRAV